MTDEEIERNALNKERDRLYKCRDLEISNLWQRSIFLSAFLILCFTGYAYVLMNIVDAYCGNNNMPQIQGSFNFVYNNLSTPNSNKLLYLNTIAMCLGFISSIFSTLWIMMAKGSKAWYEVYETAISSFEEKHREAIGLPAENVMGGMGIPKYLLNNCLFSRKAGAYSPSKINIIIGQICLIIWILITILHLIVLSVFNEPFSWYISLILLFIILYFITRICRSGFLHRIYNKKGLFISKSLKNGRVGDLYKIYRKKNTVKKKQTMG